MAKTEDQGQKKYYRIFIIINFVIFVSLMKGRGIADRHFLFEVIQVRLSRYHHSYDVLSFIERAGGILMKRLKPCSWPPS